MSQQTRVAILLPTYNGEQYLAQQLDSLLAQSHDNFVIVTRDDGSSDASAQIVARYAEKHPQRFHVLANTQGNVGAIAAFSQLISYVLENKELLGLHKAYILCCDQDDIWYRGKIATCLQRMNILESQSPGLPLLVHSDLRVVNADRRQIAASFVEYQAINPFRNSFTRLLVSNVVTGCTALINEELATLASPLPRGVVMHDWWLGLVASAFGRLSFVEEPLVEYRQHGSNTLGARQYVPREQRKDQNALSLLADDRHSELGKALAAQARACHRMFGKMLKPRQRLLLKLVSGLEGGSAVKRNLLLKLFHTVAA